MQQPTEPADVDEKSIKIFDTTLRDGEQAPNTSFSYQEKRTIASMLDEMGTHVIEAGFPVISESEFKVVRDIADSTAAVTCGLARVVDKDVEAALDSGVDMVHLFASTSDVQLEDSMHASREEVIERSVQAVRRVNEANVDVMFSPMDATRTDDVFLTRILEAVCSEDVQWINLPDTCGVSTPERFYRLVSKVRESFPGINLDVHTHDDFGLATANAIAGFRAGASRVQVTVNGIGERAGNAAYEEVIMALESLYGVESGIDTSMLAEVSDVVAEASEIPVPATKPVVGRNAFSHESGIHAAGVLENSETFEPGVMTPEEVGGERTFVLGKHTGTHAVRKRLEDAGYSPSDSEVREVTERVKDRDGETKRITGRELEQFARAANIDRTG